jgi:acetolactate synthase small subunit
MTEKPLYRRHEKEKIVELEKTVKNFSKKIASIKEGEVILSLLIKNSKIVDIFESVRKFQPQEKA